MQVDPHNVLEAGFGGLQYVGPGLWGHSGVVHQHVEAAELITRHIDQPASGVGVADIRLDVQNLGPAPAQLVERLLGRVLFAHSANRQIESLVGQTLGDAEADSPRAAGD